MNVVAYKCPACGGELTFRPDTQSFGCDYCGSTYSEAEIQQMYAQTNQTAEQTADMDAQTLQDENDYDAFENETKLYECSSCGAQIIADENTSATFCYYCHNPVVLAGRLKGDYKPDFVIPFAVTREEAEKKFKAWCRKRWFLPNSFKSKQQLEKMSGVYVPFWLTSSEVHADYQCIGEKTRTWTSGKYRITEHNEYDVRRSGVYPFERVPADGSLKIEDALMDAIEPFDYKGMRDFSMQYLSGFLADKYDVDWAHVVERAKVRMQDGARAEIRSTVTGYSSIKREHLEADCRNLRRAYVLMPVWFMNYKHNGETYSFAENGQTGNLAGTPPLSKAKLFGFCAGLFAVLTAVTTLIGGYLL